MRQSGLRRCGSAMSPTDPMQGPVAGTGIGRMRPKGPAGRRLLRHPPLRRPSRTRRTHGARLPPRPRRCGSPPSCDEAASPLRCPRPRRCNRRTRPRRPPPSMGAAPGVRSPTQGIPPKTRQAREPKRPDGPARFGQARPATGSRRRRARLPNAAGAPSRRTPAASVPENVPSYTWPLPHEGLFAFNTASLQPSCRTSSNALAAPATNASVRSAPSASTTHNARSASTISHGGWGTGWPFQHFGAHGNQLVALAQRHHGLARPRRPVVAARFA